MSLSATARHFNGTATTAPATIDMGTGVVSLIIDNLDVTNNLLISFDGGTLFKTLGVGKTLSMEISTTKLVVKSSALTVAYEVLAAVL